MTAHRGIVTAPSSGAPRTAWDSLRMVRRIVSWMGETAVALVLVIATLALTMPVVPVEAAFR